MWRRMPAPEESDSDNEDAEFDEYGDPTDGNGAYGSNGKAKDGANGGAGLQFTGDAESAQAREVLNFGKVVGDMVSTGHAEGHPASSLLMEIKGYKFAQNKVSYVIPLSVRLSACFAGYGIYGIYAKLFCSNRI
jgi:hypothetical protein